MKNLFFDIINDPNLLIAFVALVTSISSIFIGVLGLSIQIRHNKKSILPIGNINLADYDSQIKIRISNNGIGPMIIKSCKTKSSSETKVYPIDFMPEDIGFTTFRKGIEGHAIIAGESLTLLELNVAKSIESEMAIIESVRTILKDLEMKVEYTDIYGKVFTISRKFNWFNDNK